MIDDSGRNGSNSNCYEIQEDRIPIFFNSLMLIGQIYSLTIRDHSFDSKWLLSPHNVRWNFCMLNYLYDLFDALYKF